MKNIKNSLVILIHAFVGWVFCAAVMSIGMSVTTIQKTLVIHLIAAPIFFFIISIIYFKKFNFTSPLVTAIIFVGFVMLVDFFVVALLVNKNLDMFKSLLGTWIPFLLIFLSTYLTGVLVNKRQNLLNSKK